MHNTHLFYYRSAALYNIYAYATSLSGLLSQNWCLSNTAMCLVESEVNISTRNTHLIYTANAQDLFRLNISNVLNIILVDHSFHNHASNLTRLSRLRPSNYLKICPYLHMSLAVTGMSISTRSRYRSYYVYDSKSSRAPI